MAQNTPDLQFDIFSPIGAPPRAHRAHVTELAAAANIVCAADLEDFAIGRDVEMVAAGHVNHV
jgi:hypothetical protein